MHGTYPVEINMSYEAIWRANLQLTLVVAAKDAVQNASYLALKTVW